MSPNPSELKTVYTGSHISVLARGRWEFVSRNTRRPVVGIVALTEERQVVLVEQYRAPVDRRLFELPAGLAGDIAGEEHEPLLSAAKRELLEETGYAASRWTELTEGYTSPGLTDESIVLFLAEGLTRQGPGGGGEHEQISLHLVDVERVIPWLQAQDAAADLKLFAGLCAALAHIQQRDG
jgi:ADP-ribose pyrophosphatase